MPGIKLKANWVLTLNISFSFIVQNNINVFKRNSQQVWFQTLVTLLVCLYFVSIQVNVPLHVNRNRTGWKAFSIPSGATLLRFNPPGKRFIYSYQWTKWMATKQIRNLAHSAFWSTFKACQVQNHLFVKLQCKCIQFTNLHGGKLPTCCYSW